MPRDEHGASGQHRAVSEPAKPHTTMESPTTLDRDERIDTRTHDVIPPRTPPSALDPAVHGGRVPHEEDEEGEDGDGDEEVPSDTSDADDQAAAMQRPPADS